MATKVNAMTGGSLRHIHSEVAGMIVCALPHCPLPLDTSPLVPVLPVLACSSVWYSQYWNVSTGVTDEYGVYLVRKFYEYSVPGASTRCSYMYVQYVVLVECSSKKNSEDKSWVLGPSLFEELSYLRLHTYKRQEPSMTGLQAILAFENSSYVKVWMAILPRGNELLGRSDYSDARETPISSIVSHGSSDHVWPAKNGLLPGASTYCQRHGLSWAVVEGCMTSDGCVNGGWAWLWFYQQLYH